MRWIKYLLMAAVGLFVLCLLLVAFLLFILDEDDYRRLAVLGVEYYTDYKISIDGPFRLEISSNPYVYAEAIRLESKKKPAAGRNDRKIFGETGPARACFRGFRGKGTADRRSFP